MENTEKKLYYVTNQYLVAYLLCDDHKLENTQIFEVNGRKKIDFNFESTKELHNSIKDFRENEFLNKYNANLREVRRTIGQTLRGEKVGE